MKNLKKFLTAGFVLGLFLTSGGQALAYTPSFITSSATNVSQTSATLNGTFNPNGLETNAWFEVQGMSQVGPQFPIGAGTSNANYAFNLNNLTPATTYSFRAVAQNKTGTTWGGWKSFTTLGNTTNTEVDLMASDTNITAGDTSILSWTVTGWTGNCFASSSPYTSQWTGNKTYNGGPVTVSPAQTTQYTLTCNGVQDTVTIYVSPVIDNTTVDLYASRTSIIAGESSTLSWNSTGASSCTASAYPSTNQWTGTKTTNGGPVTVTPTQTTIYKLTCNGVSDMETITVTQPQQEAPDVTLTANPSTIQQGQSSTLTWTVRYATSCVASNGWSGAKNPNSGNEVVTPIMTTRYNLTCTGPGGTTQAFVIVTVTQTQNPPSVTLTANPMSVVYGGSTTLTWTVQNATSCTASSNPATSWTGAKNTAGGSQTVSGLTSTTYFNIYCTGPGGNDSATVAVTVGTQTMNPTVNITASPMTVVYDGSTTLTWHSTNASTCTAFSSPTNSQWNGAKALSGSTQVTGLKTTTTFSITCTNSNGQDATDHVTVQVGNAPVNNPSVTTNQATNITNTSATLNGFVNANGSGNVSAWFEWGTTSSLGNQTPDNNYGSTSGTNFSYFLSGLNQNTTYYFRAVAKGSNGQLVYGSTLSFTTTGVCSTCNDRLPNATTYPASNITENSATLNGFVEPNGSFATRWFEWGTSYSALYNITNKVNHGSNAGNVSDQIYGLNPNTTYYYRVVAQNQTGTAYGNVVTFTTTSRIIIDSCFTGSCAPSVVTTQASSVTSRSARLNGVAFVNGNAQTQGYFEYGTSQALGFTTPVVNLGAGQSIPMFSTIAPLSPSTTYYFRAVATNQYGTARGSILSFRTGSAGTIGTVAGVTTQANPYLTYRETTLVTNSLATGVSKPSLVFLDTNCGSQVLRPGDILECTVYWKNVSSRNLNQVLLRTGFPQELEFIKATAGNFSPVDNAVIVEIGNLAPGQEGSMTFTTQVRTDAELGKIIVVASNLVYTYTGDNGALNQEEVFSYSDHLIQDGNKVLGLSGNALFSGVFLPTTLLGWLLLLLLILLILLALRMAYNNMRPTTVVNVPPYNHTTTTTTL